MSITVCRQLRDVPPGWYLGDCAVSGGTMERYLKEAMAFSAGKLCIRFRSFAALYPLPSPAGSGRCPSQEEIRHLRSIHKGRYSPALMTNYLTFQADGCLYCLLFDTNDTLSRKLELLKALGIPMVLMEDTSLLHLI